MGVFGIKRRKSKGSNKFSTESVSNSKDRDEEQQQFYGDSSRPEETSSVDRFATSSDAASFTLNDRPTLDMVPSLTNLLSCAEDTCSNESELALRMLFALSEHDDSHNNENRIAMVRAGGGTLVPALLKFLQCCTGGSSEQYLTILVLNNLSIPAENKRLIALDYGGVAVFAKMLRYDLSCHLAAIILVNLTFVSNGELHSELVKSNLELIPSLALAFTLSSMTKEEYEARLPLVTNDDQRTHRTASEILLVLMAEEQRVRPSSAKAGAEYGASSIMDYDTGHKEGMAIPVDPELQLFTETAKWSLGAIKNLTRPSCDSTAIRALTKTGVIPLILRCITLGDDIQKQEQRKLPLEGVGSFNSSSNSVASRPFETSDTEKGEFTNIPIWDTNSLPDAALCIIMNLASKSASRPYLRELDAVGKLCDIIDFQKRRLVDYTLTSDEMKRLEFQSLKARMTLSYLLASEGNFGQPRMRFSAIKSNLTDVALHVDKSEVDLLVELLSNTLHDRAKAGAGGYSAVAFNVKCAIDAIRCLLTLKWNQTLFFTAASETLNALLIKALALHVAQKTETIDPQTAGHACFCLYLLSNYGFQRGFLPFWPYISEGDLPHSIIARILTAYLRMKTITPAGKHASEQLLLRLPYLVFNETDFDHATATVGVKLSDLSLGIGVLRVIKGFDLDQYVPGARPLPEIFSEPIFRSRKTATSYKKVCIDVFPSALDAVQELSFGSTKVNHLDAIDDIMIANNIASSANGENAESYNYWWSWHTNLDVIEEKKLEQQQSTDSFTSSSVLSWRDQVRQIDRDRSLMDSPVHNSFSESRQNPFLSFLARQCGCTNIEQTESYSESFENSI